MSDPKAYLSQFKNKLTTILEAKSSEYERKLADELESRGIRKVHGALRRLDEDLKEQRTFLEALPIADFYQSLTRMVADHLKTEHEQVYSELVEAIETRDPQALNHLNI